jgi:ligand-binding sensor domain-containing protein
MLKRILVLFIVFMVGVHAGAQRSPILHSYRQYTLHDGLSQMQIMKIMQDSRGTIWIGTKAGLNCYNGEKFTSYTAQKNGLADDYICDITEDNSGRIWASTETGIFYIDGEKLVHFKCDSVSAAHLSPDNDRKVWFVAADNIRKNHFGYIEDEKLVFLDSGLPTHRFTPLLDISANEGAIVFSMDSVLYRYENNSSKEVFRNGVVIDFIPNSNKKCFFPDSEDLKNFDLKAFQDGKIESIAKVRDGKYLEKPILKDSLFFVSNMLTKSYIGLMPENVLYDFTEGVFPNALLLDDEGYVWVGSEEGLYQLFDNGFTTYNKEYLPQVWAVTEDLKGDLWFSSFHFGLFKMDNGEFRRIPDLERMNAAYFYFHPTVDKRGKLYFPNAYGLLTVEGNKFHQTSDSLYLTTFYDKENDILWGGSRKQAVAFDASGRKIRTIGEKEGLNVGYNVLVISKDSSGQFWFGGGKGVACYNWETGKLKKYNPGNKNYGIVTILNDFKGRTWLGSDMGLFWYDNQKDTLLQLECEELSGAVNLLTAIEQKWLVISQPYGIYLMDLQEYYGTGSIRLYLFNEKNGFLGVEPGQDGAFRDSQGKIWMTTSTELVVLDPQKLRLGQNRLSVRLVKCNEKRLPFHFSNIELQPNQNSATITFEVIGFNRPNPVQYSWKLGKDSIWSAWQQEDYAVISGLQDGQTRLMVRAMVKGLPMSAPSVVQTDLIVRMAVYRQPWFFPALFAFITLLGILSLGFTLLRMKKASLDAKLFQMQAIQSQMNPHFIFNALASLQSMILRANISKANDYLVKLAELIRSFLEASIETGNTRDLKDRTGLASISGEIKMIYEFIDFHQTINPERFEFRVIVGDGIDVENECIPPMLIQPFVENAIRHGILPSKREGLLELVFEKTDGKLIITVRDNGIGIQNANDLLEKSPLRYTSRGRELTFKRIQLLNQLGYPVSTQTESSGDGTTIKIIIDR